MARLADAVRKVADDYIDWNGPLAKVGVHPFAFL
jgi:hypothetical protein